MLPNPRQSAALTLTLLLAACVVEPTPVTELARYPMNAIDDLITRDGLTLDTEVSSDDAGSVRIDATETTTVRLLETGDLDVENARLIYRAKLRTKDVTGRVYLEMWCEFEGKGEYFSRALDSALSGTNGWSSQETPFFLKKGQNPSNVKLNLVIEGGGTVWIDDVRVVGGPLG